MAEQTTVTTQPAIENAPVAAPSTGGFAPQISTYSVGVLTLGRNKNNDADKEWYFE